MSRHFTLIRAPGFPALCLSAFFLATAHAAPINYSESVSGDLPALSPPAVFVLDVGVNTISGTCGFDTVGGPGDYDSFAFIIPATMELTSGNVVVSDAVGEFISSAWALRSGSVTSMDGTLVGNLTCPSPGSVNFPGTPLFPGSYNMWHGTFTGFGTGISTGNYTFTMNVIPEPAALILLPLAALCLRRQR